MAIYIVSKGLYLIGVLSLAIANSAVSLSEADLEINPKIWCEDRGGEWAENICGWSEVNLDEELETTLNQECRDRAGVWQTLTEGIYGPSFCGGDVCTLDLVLIDYSFTGVGCVWYPDIQSPGKASE